MPSPLSIDSPSHLYHQTLAHRPPPNIRPPNPHHTLPPQPIRQSASPATQSFRTLCNNLRPCSINLNLLFASHFAGLFDKDSHPDTSYLRLFTSPFPALDHRAQRPSRPVSLYRPLTCGPNGLPHRSETLIKSSQLYSSSFPHACALEVWNSVRPLCGCVLSSWACTAISTHLYRRAHHLTTMTANKPATCGTVQNVALPKTDPYDFLPDMFRRAFM
ncbi:hypothetical protein C8Q74DRAFT_704637 [Fomes fomentarius]|nr:hypothetical protein C8Q74DRAFT_704637 [Fomes fomentarius]